MFSCGYAKSGLDNDVNEAPTPETMVTNFAEVNKHSSLSWGQSGCVLEKYLGMETW